MCFLPAWTDPDMCFGQYFGRVYRYIYIDNEHIFGPGNIWTCTMTRSRHTVEEEFQTQMPTDWQLN